MKILFIINDAPYGSEKAYNALRLASQILKDYPETAVNIFLLANAIGCGIGEQKTPEGYYNIGRMIKLFINKGGKVKACGICMDTRGITGQILQDGAQRSNMGELTQWTVDADKVITF